MKLLQIIAIVIILFPVRLLGQERVISVAELEAVKNPELVEGDAALRFVSNSISVGDICEDDSSRIYRFEFANVSRYSLSLTKVVTSCGCTTATFSKEFMQPGEKGIIELRFNPQNQAGIVDNRTFVYTTLSDDKPTAVISLIGEVNPTSNVWIDYPKAMGVLRVKRKTISFNEVTTSSVQTERMVCGNSGDNPLKLTAFTLPAYATFRTEPEVIPAGGEADIVITIDGKKIGKSGLIKFPIIIQGLHGAPSNRTLSVEVNVGEGR